MIEANKQPVSIDSVYSGETVSLEIPNPNEMVLTVKNGQGRNGWYCGELRPRLVRDTEG